MAGRRSRRGLVGVTGLVVAVVLTAGGCGEGPGSEPEREGCGSGAACGTPLRTTAVPIAPVDLQLRPVQSTTAASVADNPCPTDLPTPAPAEVVVSPGCSDGVIDVLYGLGPSALDGSAFDSATAVRDQNTGDWVVNPVLKPGADGLEPFNAVAARCFARDTTCPTGQLAIVIDGVVISAPTIQSQGFEADQIRISGAPFTEAEAEALASGFDGAG